MIRRVPVFSSLESAENYVLENRCSGVECPCCGQYCKIYERSLNYAMARFLIWLVRSYLGCRRWWGVNEGPVIQHRKGGGDFAKMEHWGLIVSRPNDDPKKRMSGHWKPTEKGIDFVYGRIYLPAKVHLYNNQAVAWSSEVINIVDALGKKFDYRELMGET